jgi:hypothetical protein
MIGVTIGVGAYYSALAHVAAACLKKQADVNSVILSDRHFLESGLHHPAALKFRIFDLVSACNILYYDADWFCVKKWRPQTFAQHRRIVACHDFVLATDWPAQAFDFEAEAVECRASDRVFVGEPKGPLRQDYIADVERSIGLGLPPRRWINTGMFIVNRVYHRYWLDRGEYLYRQPGGHHDKYFEQPAMLKALEELGIGVDYLPRAHNVLVTRVSLWPDSVVGLHLKMSKHREFGDLIRALHETRLTPDMIEEMFLGGLRARSSI